MIERQEFNNDMDFASISGRATLLGGGGYGVYQTIKESGNPLTANYFKNKMAGSLKGSFEKRAGIKTQLKSSTIAKDIMSMPRESGYSVSEARSTGGYRSRSKDFEKEYQKLKEAFGKEGIFPEEIRFEKEGKLKSILLKLDKKTSFDIPIVSQEGEIYRGSNKYTSRSFLSNPNSLRDGVKLEGLDVAMVKGIRGNLRKVISGELSPKKLREEYIKAAIWEDRNYGDKNISKMRKEEFVVRGSKGEKDYVRGILSSKKGYTAGTASMAAKDIYSTPDSLLSKLPGSGTSPSAKQILRESKFQGMPETKINWLGKGEKGSLSGLRNLEITDFKTKWGTDTGEVALSRALKKMGAGAGELAEEELLLNPKLRGKKITNNLYSRSVDLQEGQTSFMRRTLYDLRKKSQSLAIEMSSGEGIKNLNYDITERLTLMQGKEAAMTEKIKGIRKDKSRFKELNRLKKGRSTLRNAIKNYGLLGYEEGTGAEIRLPRGDTKEFLDAAQIDKKGKLKFSFRSEYELGTGQKLFGHKMTIDSRNIDINRLAATIERDRVQMSGGKPGSLESYQRSMGEIDTISLGGDPIKLKGEAINPKDVSSTIMSYAERAADEGRFKELKQLGITPEGGFNGKLEGDEIIKRIKEMNPDKTNQEIFGGKEFASGKISRTVVAPDISSGQAGAGKIGNISQRGAFNLQAMGLDETTKDILSRRRLAVNPLDQLEEINKMKSRMLDATTKSVPAESVSQDLDRIFQKDLGARRTAIKGDHLIVDLGKKIRGQSQIAIPAAESLSPFIGGVQGGGLSEIDRAAQGLIRGINGDHSETKMNSLMKDYQTAMGMTEENVLKSMAKGKVSGSMYGQAASSLEGLDKISAELGKQMGLKGAHGPVVAMTENDMLERFGRGSLKKARSKEGLFGVVTREPIEGVHSTIPSKIVVANDLANGALKDGQINVSKGMIRKGLFLDFDKDMVNVIAANSEKSSAELKGFLGVGGKQSVLGKEYLNSLDRISSFNLKGKDPISIENLSKSEAGRIIAEQKSMEKRAIGLFSNEFGKVHSGLQDQLAGNITKASAEKFYLGEDFSHLFVENVLKAKHQGKEALLSGSGMDSLHILRKKIGTPYAKMPEKERAKSLQKAFDEISYGDAKTAEKIRQHSGGMTETLATEMGLGKEIQGAKAGGNDLSAILARAQKQKESFSKISEISNLENVLAAHTAGSVEGKLGRIKNIAQKTETGISSKFGKIEEAGRMASKIISNGIKKVGLYGVLPAAAIGLAASMMSSPKKLSPALDTGKLHEKDVEYSKGLGTASGGKTLFSIPESRTNGMTIKGVANHKTSFSGMQQQIATKGSGSIRTQDHRSYMDKYTVKDMIEKGH